jgi:hypothetical protein
MWPHLVDVQRMVASGVALDASITRWKGERRAEHVLTKGALPGRASTTLDNAEGATRFPDAVSSATPVRDELGA